MFIVMHCGGLPFNGQTIKESSLGGSESAAYYVALELAKAGHKVTIFTNSQDTGIFDGVKYEWAGEISAAAPLGDRFTFYAQHTPHDICIIQRSPHAFERKLASKLNFLWLHDLALVRNREAYTNQMWNVDKVLCVSEWHKEQVCDTWGISKDIVAVVNNGVDLALFADDIAGQVARSRGMELAGVIPLLYSSRPERGLINLLAPDGIMERLQKEMPAAHLYVCGYENKTPQMAEFYDYLYARCEVLPNVTNLGALTKQQLADAMRQCAALVYPTDFEEVSCITAMEAMAAGLPFISSEVAALPETCKGSGSILLPLKDGKVDIDQFVITTRQMCEDNPIVLPSHAEYRVFQIGASKKFTWNRAASTIEDVARSIFKEHGSARALAFHFMRHSDIAALEHCGLSTAPGSLANELRREYEIGYEFYRNNTYAEHYKSYYEYEKERGVTYGPEDVSHTVRFQHIYNLVSTLPAGSRVLDYGCAHGHYTIPLARFFPHLTFVGADLAESNVVTAMAWAAEEKLTNIDFIHVRGGVADVGAVCAERFDLVIAAEVVEHVGNPQELIDDLSGELKGSGQMVITTPYGPWEAQGYREHGYWRAHIHHFERADLHEMLGHHPDFKICVAPSGESQFHSPLGSYITSFRKPTEPSLSIDYKRKIAETMPDQTVSLCMIVKDGALDLPNSLKRALPFVHEVIIGIDPATTDETLLVVEKIRAQNPLVAFDIFMLDHTAKEWGFANARNSTIKRASCDWVLWLDADEELVSGDFIAQYTRNNQYNGYAVRQHHFSQKPTCVMKVDLPCRLFRNGKGIKFFGAVHEHPETALNEGVGHASLLPHAEIIHYGYTDEPTRRKRFARNISLLERDRKETPDRMLGKFLMLRDLAQMCQYDIEDRRMDMDTFTARAREGMVLFDELLEAGNTRLILDSLQFYSLLVEVHGGGFDFGVSIDASKLNGGVHMERQVPVVGKFLTMAHVEKVMALMLKDKTQGYDSRYF